MTTPSKTTTQKDSDKIDDKGSTSDEVVEVDGFPAHLTEMRAKSRSNTKSGSNSKSPSHKRKTTSGKRNRTTKVPRSSRKQQEVQD